MIRTIILTLLIIIANSIHGHYLEYTNVLKEGSVFYLVRWCMGVAAGIILTITVLIYLGGVA